jgi:acyl-CoA reductase-like NAD-dependent aldehyde dehydrogenase
VHRHRDRRPRSRRDGGAARRGLCDGQVCYSVERVYVHESVHDAFVAKLVEQAKAVRLNADNPRAGHIGPFTFARRRRS